MSIVTLKSLEWIPAVRFELAEHKLYLKDNVFLVGFLGVVGALLLAGAGCSFAGMGAQNIAVVFSITGGITELGMAAFAVASFRAWKQVKKDVKTQLTEDELTEILQNTVLSQKGMVADATRECEKDQVHLEKHTAWLNVVNSHSQKVDALIDELGLEIEKCLPEESDDSSSTSSSDESDSDSEYTFDV